MRALQTELEEIRQDRTRDREREARRRQQDEEELQILRERCEKLEEERNNGQNGVRETLVFVHLL
jgi:protein SPA2